MNLLYLPPQIRAWICVALIVVLRLLNLAVPILYKKVRLLGWIRRHG